MTVQEWSGKYVSDAIRVLKKGKCFTIETCNEWENGLYIEDKNQYLAVAPAITALKSLGYFVKVNALTANITKYTVAVKEDIVKAQAKLSERQFIEYMMEIFEERRTDVADMCDEFLRYGTTKRLPEHRFIYACIPGTAIELEYDTLTTELSYRSNSHEWETCANHLYVGA